MWLISDFADTNRVSRHDTRFQLMRGDLYDSEKPVLHRSAIKIHAGESTSGTGAVISDDGLILTSYFMTVQALSRLSSPRNNLIEDGFSAPSNDREIPLQNYRLLVPLKQKDVTKWITSRIPDTAGVRDSLRQQRDLHRKLTQKYENGYPDRHVQIKEIYGGNRQLLVVYRGISDVRLVQVPPASIGRHRGPSSHHAWPHYSGSYALLRAYVSPDGSSRPYNRGNTPWQPEQHLAIDPTGLQTGEPYIALGYPGSTYRQQSSYAYRYYQKDLNPYIEKALEDVVEGLELAAASDTALAIQNYGQRTSLYRSLEYYEGVKDGFATHNLIERKQELEREFSSWMERDSLRNLRYGRVIDELEKSFRIARQNAPVLYTSLHAINHNKLLQIARLYHSYYDYTKHPDSLKFTARQRQGTLHRHRNVMENIDLEAQLHMLTELLVNFYELPADNQLPFFHAAFDHDDVSSFRSSAKAFLQRQRKQSVVFDTARGRRLLNMKPAAVQETAPDSLLELFDAIYHGFKVGRKNNRQHHPYLNPARRYYIEGIHRMRSDAYRNPDANGTLRLSVGTVKPTESVKDSTSPYVSIADLVAAAEQHNRPLPDIINHWKEQRDRDKFLSVGQKNRKLPDDRGEFPISVLTNHNVTDGFTGGPLLSQDGTLGGITLENNYEGLIGDFYVDPKNKRAINVDIRFILALIDHYDEQKHIVPSLSIDGSP